MKTNPSIRFDRSEPLARTDVRRRGAEHRAVRRGLFFRVSVGLVGVVLLGAGVARAADVDFTRDIRPILSNNCFACHGPDESHREADLRLDRFETTGEISGATDVIVAGQPDESELFLRVSSDDEFMVMPPADSGKKLTPQEIKLLGQWIQDGAPYREHWSWVAPRLPELPAVSHSDWVRNPIDAFVLARLEREGLAPAPVAGQVELLRRLSLDLIGLPPTIDEVDAFLSDGSPNAWENQVDRLLDSPHYGERWGRLWLDAARYADSDGFEKDKPRQVWIYRDWVIKAMNDDMPYDQFVIEQIAGDLLPDATQDQFVATGFLRNSMINEEGGIDPEQFRMEAMFDRMDAIGKSVLGLTIQCAQCHSHKYDPLTHQDYYRLLAFLNNCHEGQMAVYTGEQLQERKAILNEIRAIEGELRAEHADWPERMRTWESSIRDGQPDWLIVRPELDASGGQKHYLLDDGSILAQGYAPTKHVSEFAADVHSPRITAIKLELLNDPNLPGGGPGRSIDGLCALTEFEATAVPLDHPDQTIDVKFSRATADVNPSELPLDDVFDDRKNQKRVTGPIEYANDGDELTAWAIDSGPGRSNVAHQAVFTLEQPLESDAGYRITFKLAQKHGGWNSDDNQNNNLGRFRLSVTSADGAQADPLPARVREIVATPAAKRTQAMTEDVFSYWRTTVSEWHDANDRIEALWRSHPKGTTQLVLLERDDPRETHRLNRGDFLQQEEQVTGGVPSFLNALPDDAPQSRLALARWLADRDSPTTARAVVNRMWQAYFGTGLVATAEDLGTQGEFPTHPELLDWLAVEFMEHGWSRKHLHRLIVNSSTYQQASNVTSEQHTRDPNNRLLARGSRFRVDAETVRDIALAASGLLSHEVGGPSVYPPAPDFLFQPPSSYGPKTWNLETGSDRYRRALYTFRFRSVPYPALENFDAPNGDIACVRRARSNTPVQALTTLNEPLFVECARALAAMTLKSGADNQSEQIAYAFRRCLARPPHPDEARMLEAFLETQRQRFSSHELDPKLLIADATMANDAAERPSLDLPAGVSPEEMAAWTALARVILNLDETITRE